jgi:hypothetical protein
LGWGLGSGGKGCFIGLGASYYIVFKVAGIADKPHLVGIARLAQHIAVGCAFAGFAPVACFLFGLYHAAVQ